MTCFDPDCNSIFCLFQRRSGFTQLCVFNMFLRELTGVEVREKTLSAHANLTLKKTRTAAAYKKYSVTTNVYTLNSENDC